MEKKVKFYPWGSPIKKTIIESQDIVSYYNKEVVKKIGEREDDFIIKHKVTEYDRMNRSDYIKSHQNDVGVQNMIKKSLRNGESPDFVMNEKFRSKQNGLVDMVKVEEALSNPDAFAKKSIEAYKKIPKVIKKDKSARDLTKMSDAELRSYVDKIIAERQKISAKVKNIEESEKK